MQKEPEDFGQVIAALARDIQKRELRLNELRLRERRATLLVTLYTFAGWGAYLGLWYTQLLPQMSGHRPNSRVEKAVKGFPAILGPIMYVIIPPPLLSAYMTNLVSRILFTRRIVQLWFNRKGNAEGMRHRQQPRGGLVLTSLKYFSEKSLAALKLERRNKVEDFKRKTNYYETRELLERYEDGQRDSAGLVARPIDGSSSRLQPQQLPVTPQRAVPAVPPNTPANIRTSISPALQSQLTRRSSAWLLIRMMHLMHPLSPRRDPAAAPPTPAKALV